MPNLNLVMSIATILLTAMWFFDPGVRKGISELTPRNPVTWMVGLYLLHVVWLINTSDWHYAAKDLRIKLPLLALALNPGTVKLGRGELKLIFAAFGIGIGIASVVGYILYFSEPLAKLDPRLMVPDISHIRLSLMMLIFVGGGAYFFREVSGKIKAAILISVLNVGIFLYLLQSLTAFAVLVAAAVILITRHYLRRLSFVVIGLSGAVILIAGFFYLKSYYDSYFATNENTLPLMEYTAEGNPYNHYDTLQIENGNFVYANISEYELVENWNARSDMKIGYDPMVNTELITRIVRYLTSKGLPKNGEAVRSLSEEEIEWIEQGYPTIIHAQRTGLSLRVHTFLHGAHLFLSKGKAEGSSFFQRLITLKVGWELVKKNPLFGAGTGDVLEEFKRAYEEYPVFIEPKYRLRAHNQFLTFLISFGIFGFAYFVVFIFQLFRASKQNLLFLFFAVVACFSFLSEDTLETQAGVTFFAFFTALFSAFDPSKR
jgi:hypothetical protein